MPEHQLCNRGFTLIELMIVLAVIAILLSVSVPVLMLWYDTVGVKSAARDLYAAMQEVRMIAVEQNADAAIVFKLGDFDPVYGGDGYYICRDRGADGDWGTIGDNTIERSVSLDSQAYKNNVQFGAGMGATPVDASFGDFVTYANNVLVVNSRGTGSAGYVYLTNRNGYTYAVGTQSSGYVKFRKWYITGWS
ncbi:GspH/FimT family pseudopilin [uncultured Desulfobacter sp.]|uniref:GspH/FimT family pseudopilin n=1 Tax=uncultured Desulfobacter sp. TaxID=240139 RepID=UPI002AAC289B|nr:GspH/FimT family pseudopilin [uncultured Desulfobacter sp.]